MNIPSHIVFGVLLIVVGITGAFNRELIFQTCGAYKAGIARRRGKRSTTGDAAVIGGILMALAGILLLFFPGLPDRILAMLNANLDSFFKTILPH